MRFDINPAFKKNGNFLCKVLTTEWVVGERLETSGAEERPQLRVAHVGWLGFGVTFEAWVLLGLAEDQTTKPPIKGRLTFQVSPASTIQLRLFLA